MKRKIILVIPSMNAGGAERFMSILFNNINREKFEVKLLILNSNYIHYKLYPNSENEISYLYFDRISKAIWKIYKTIQKDKPDIVFTTLTHLNILIGLLAYRFKCVRFIARESSIASINNRSSKLSFFLNLFQRKVYKNFTYIICQSNDMLIDLNRNFGLGIHKLKVIPNPVECNSEEIYSADICNPKTDAVRMVNFITIGRLSPEKGHLRIIKILSKLHYDFNYTIIGEGPLLNEIQTAIEKYQLKGMIKILSKTNDIEKYLKNSDCFLMASTYEGFPNVVLEAGILGVPCLAFNSVGGIKDAIKQNVNGWLIPIHKDEEYLEALNKRIFAEIDKKTIHDFVFENFNAKKIILEYEKIIQLFL